ncbi:response regulator [Paenibacillus faecalis]|uniref:response regulator n=1 Tax=Paenibacillus faecalis TaxID=2079532 RepID=UPI000D100E2E|nr:response regulator [Paenibacillus faecalis]
MKKIEVVLIEDDPMVQEVNRAFVDKVDGFTVTGIASTDEEGLEKLKELEPDLVLLDIYIPKKNGLDLIRQLRQDQIDVDIIAVTAANDIHTIKTLLRNGVTDYVIKPFTFERLQKALTQYKNVYHQFHQVKEVSQEKLDEVMSKNKHQKKESLPKGVHEHTLNQIFNYLQNMDEAKSAETIGTEVGLARVTVRRYLSYLETIGKVEMELTYGTIGRPIQLYRLKR